MNLLELEFFHGLFTLERAVSNGTKMVGVVQFDVLSENSLSYFEKGNVVLPDLTQLPFERFYVYEISHNKLAVFFDAQKTQLFQNITLTSKENALIGQAVHHCLDDIYSSLYAFYPDYRFTISHHVTGPKKDYHITTQFIKKMPFS
jgi:hypothetical protein